MASTKKKTKPFRGVFWCGFSDGRPHLFHPADGAPYREQAMSLSRTKKRVPYQDVRKVEIREVAKP